MLSLLELCVEVVVVLKWIAALHQTDDLIEMAEALAKKKRVRAGHKASATRLLGQVDDAIANTEALDVSKLTLLKMSLNEKLRTLKTLDREIVDLIENETA